MKKYYISTAWREIECTEADLIRNITKLVDFNGYVEIWSEQRKPIRFGAKWVKLYHGFDEDHGAAEWARLLGVSRTSMWRYLQKGLTVEEIAKKRGIEYPKN